MARAADDGGAGLSASAVRGFRAAFDAKVEEAGAQLEQEKARNRSADDELGRRLDKVRKP